MTRLRTFTVLATAAMLLSTGTVALAQGPDDAYIATAESPERLVDEPTVRPLDRVVDRPTVRPLDRPADRPVDRPVPLPECDRSTDRPVDCRHRAAPRPQCDRDPAPDRPIDCRDHDWDIDRGFARRCYHYLAGRVDLRPADDRRLFWLLCHRIWWWYHHH